MRIVTKKLSHLRHPEINSRIHPEKQIAEFRRSVAKFGQIRPLVIDERNVIWIGNGLYDAFVSMGWTEAACMVVSDLSESDKKKLMLADNRLFSLGVDDMDAFDAILKELGEDLLDIPGYDDELLETLSASVAEVDEILADYGLISDEKKEEMAGAAAADPPVRRRPVQPEHQAEAGEEDGNVIICPSCGEKIWL